MFFDTQTLNEDISQGCHVMFESHVTALFREAERGEEIKEKRQDGEEGETRKDSRFKIQRSLLP